MLPIENIKIIKKYINDLVEKRVKNQKEFDNILDDLDMGCQKNIDKATTELSILLAEANLINDELEILYNILKNILSELMN